MEINIFVNKYKSARYNFFKWRTELELGYKVMLALSFACMTGLLAQIKFYLPWSPVPITGQTFAVLLSAIMLGRWAAVSQGMYLGIGVAGVPWFANWTGGIGIITGATFGYLIGFIIAAFFLGYFVDKYVRSRSFISMLGLMLFANFVIIHGLGLLHLYLWSSTILGNPFTIVELIIIGVVPFIIGDIIKILTAAGITRAITPKRAYNGEVDAGKWKTWPIP